MHLSEIAIYPVKGCRRTVLGEVATGPRGLAGDREWMVVRPDGLFLTQRTHPGLARIVPRYRGASLELAHPRLPLLEVAAAGARTPLEVTVWGRRALALDAGERAAEWLSHALGVPARLVSAGPGTVMWADRAYVGERDVPLSFADGYPVLVCNAASLDDLNARLPVPVPMERFRPNLVITGLGAFAEDGIRTLRIGSVELRFVKPCTRCTVPAIDQATGEPGTDPAPALKAFRFDRTLRGVTFGVNATIEAPPGSALAVGEAVVIVA